MLYNGSEVIRDVEWVIFDEVHYINDTEVLNICTYTLYNAALTIAMLCPLLCIYCTYCGVLCVVCV